MGNPISGIATSIDATGRINGYWLVIQDGGVLSFGSAPFWEVPAVMTVW